MVKVVIAGIPKKQKLLRIISFLNTLVEELVINASLTKTVYTDNYTKQITLVVRGSDVRKLRKAVHGYLYRYGNRDYPLECWVESAEGQTIGKSSKLSKTPIKDTEYLVDPTAVLNDELQAIDHKIELVKKQRLLIEEESKLLLERKKLQILKNIGVNDVEKLKKFEEIKDRNNPAEIADLAIEVELPNDDSKKGPDKLPKFYGPVRALFAEMNDLIQKYVNPDNKAILLALIRSTIKKRLIVVLKGKEYLVLQDIVELYRATYPATTDEKMVQSLLTKISQSCWPKTSLTDGQQSETETIATVAQEKKPNSHLTILDLTREELLNINQRCGVSKGRIDDPEDVDDIDLENDVDDWEEESNQGAETMNDESTERTVEENTAVQVKKKESGTEEMENEEIFLMEEKNNEQINNKEDDTIMVQEENATKIDYNKVVEKNDQ